MRPCVLFLAVVLAVVPVPSIAMQYDAPFGPSEIAFDLERPDTAGFVGFGNIIRIDSSGRTHVAYTGSASGVSGIRHAQKLDSGWAIESIPGTRDAGPLDLALDQSGQPWIAFATGSGILVGDHLGPLFVAHRSGEAWTTESLDSRAAYDYPIAAAFDASGILHVAFAREARPATIVYATRGEAGWLFEPVAQEYFGTNGLSLAFDGDGRAHVAWCNPTRTSHGIRTSQGWAIQDLPGANTVSLAMDPIGAPRLVTSGESSSGSPSTRYYVFGGGVWSVEEIDPLVLTSRDDLRLQVDRYGRPFVAFTESGRRLSLAWKNGGAWISQVVDPDARAQIPSLALAGGRSPRISYLDLVPWDLGVASGDPPQPPEPLAARAFLAGEARTIPIVPGSGGDIEVRLEPVDLDYANSDVEPESVVMLSEGAGDLSEIHAVATKAIANGDLDRNGVEELCFRFSGPDLAGLFSAVVGRIRVEVTLEANLRSGGWVRAPLELTLVVAGARRGSRVRPNPLNPTGTLGFVVTRPGLLRVDVFDASGRIVRRLANEWVAATGYRELPLTADAAGHSLRSGVYFYRVLTADEVYSGRFVVLK